MLTINKTKYNFFNNIYISQKDKRSQYISRSTNKKISSEKNNKSKTNKRPEEKNKISSSLMEVNKNGFQNPNNKYKKFASNFFQNNSLYNLITKTQNNNISNKNNIKVISIPKNKLLLQENSANNSSIIFNLNEDQKMKGNYSSISTHKQKNSKKKIYNGDTKNIKKYKYINKEFENKANINIQKYSSKKQYENNQKNYGQYLNSNNNSKEENITKNKNNINCNKNGNNKNYNNNDILLDYNNNNNNNINYITYHKNKNNINNKLILQKILSNLFSSNKKKNNIKKDNNNNRENKFINDSFNNKITSKKNNYFNNNNNNNNENKNIDRRRETPKLKASNTNNKKISGLFSANHKDKDSNIITDICNSKSKKTNENLTKRNLSINIHSYNVNECKFKTSINYEIFSKKADNNNIPKLNLNQVFNLKLYDKNKINNNNYSSNNNIGLKNDNHIKENNIKKNDEKDKILYFISSSNNININDNVKNKTNIHNSKSNSNTIQNYNKKNENTNKNNTNNKKKKFSPKNIFTKDIRKSHLQRFFSYSKEKANIKNNIIFMNNIKKINFNENRKSESKNSVRRFVKSNDNKSQGNFGEVKNINKKSNHNSYSKISRGKDIDNDTYINLRKRRSKYSDINKIIEINNLKYINNSEISNLKKYNDNFNTNEPIKNIKIQKRNNHSASHNNLNNNKGKYDISKIGNLFKPILEKNIRGSYKETNRRKNNLDMISSIGKKNKNKNNNNYSSQKSKNKNKNNKTNNIKIQNNNNEIYTSNKKDYQCNYNNLYNQLDIEEMVNLDIDEKKTKENIFQNSLTMYSIYILSKYYKTCNKIGISKISIYDKNKKIIPIEYSNTNEGTNINYLFDINSQYKNSHNFALITDFKENFCVNFYIKNINNLFLDYIYIYNYSDVNNGISPVKEIKIFKTNILLYKGCLNLNNPNIIKISNFNKEEDNKENIEISTNEKYNILKNEKSLTFTIFKSLINDNLDNNDNNTNNFKINKFNSARNTFPTNRYSEDSYFNKNINNNNNLNNNISNSFVNNNEYKKNDISDNLLFFHNSNNFFNTQKVISNTSKSTLNYLGNEFNINGKNEDTNFSKTLKLPNYTNKLFLSSYNSALDDIDNLFRTSMGYVYKQEDSENNNNENNKNSNKEINNNENNNDENNNYDKNYEKNININEYNNSNNYFFNNNDVDKNYVEFNKINIFLKANYGHRKYIGLTGIIFIDENNEKIDIEKAETIGALPKDLRTEYNDDSDNRIFENVFNGINNTNEADNMWVTKFKKKENPPYLELIFEKKIKLSKIIIYNYNQKDKLEIGTKIIDLYLDNYFYKTIYLVQGTGEIANINNDNNLNDFGQEIYFNTEYDNYDTSNKMSMAGLTLYDKQEINDIKYASKLFLQCYETPYLPCGNFVKMQFLSYYFDNNDNGSDYEGNELFLGLDNIEIFNEEGINILNYNNENKKFNYKIISNRELKNDLENNNNILIKGMFNEDENQNKIFDNENNIFYIFDKFVQISYIKFTPINNDIYNFNHKIVHKIKEIKIFCEDKIIFEGSIYNNKPTIILFTSENKITKGINQNYLTKYCERIIKEIKTDNYFSLILN